ncbi:FimV/HubP family polar landmark protein [Mariprofundus micogutta]|nr:FimV/HubP family polar landmark protein [Mariprofundus micogutta]
MKWLFAVVLFALPVHAYALGFGTLELNSHLNERLKAQVPIVLSGSENIDQIKVELASGSEYRQMGLPWHESYDLIKVMIENKHSRSPVIALSSIAVIRLPILSIVLKANKAGRGTYFRHYQLLLDPVEMTAMNRSLPSVLPVRLPELQTSVLPGSEETVDDSAWTRIWRYGPVRAGDNLSEIAYRLRKDKRYSNRQVMLSLYEQNPGSFLGGNINHLKQGAWLTVPSGEVVKKYASATAMKKLAGLLHKPKAAVSAPPVAKIPAGSDKVAAQTEELHYSGRINLADAATSQKMAEQILDEVSKASNAKLESIHQQMMSGQLQMDNLNETVATLGKSMDGLQADVKSIKADVKLLKLNAQKPKESSDDFWMISFFLLLAAVAGLIIGMLIRKSKQKSPVEHRQKTEKSEVKEESAKENEDVIQPLQPVPNKALDAVDSKINKIEECLGQCKYEEVESLLDEAVALAPNSLRISILRAQLYHETGRIEDRNDLINSMSESSDKKRWESFCHLLPTHVWQACFGEGSAEEHGK